MQRAGSMTAWKCRARLASLALAVLVIVPPAFAQKPTTTKPAAAKPAAATTTLDRIRQTARIRLGYRTDARPFSFAESGKAAGYSVALCQEVANAVKSELGLTALTVEWVPVTLEDRFLAVQQARVDLLCGADTKTLARMKEVAFSTSTFPGGIGALVRTDASTSLKDVLSGRKPASQPNWRASSIQLLQTQIFSVINGTTAESWVNAKKQEFKLSSKVVPVDSYDAGVQRVLDRKANVFFGDRAILLDAAARNPAATKLMVLDRLFTYEPMALAFARGDDDFRLLVDRTLSKLYNSGQIEALYAASFGKPDASTLSYFKWYTVPE